MRIKQIKHKTFLLLRIYFLFSCMILCWPCFGEIIDDEAPSPAPTSLDPVRKNAPQAEESLNDKLPQVKQGSKEKGSQSTSSKEMAPKGVEEKKGKPPNRQGNARPRENVPVHFTSQGLKGLRERGLVELMKDVLVTQGDLRIEADNAQVFFSEESKEVKKIVALGQPVKMSNIDPNTGEKLEAIGNQIEFNNADRVVLLEGNARIKKGNNSTIKGKKITYELDSGWIKADKVAGEISPQKQ